MDPSPSNAGLSDQELADWLENKHSNKTTVVYVHATHLFRVYEDAGRPVEMIKGDLGSNSIKVLRKVAKSNRLKRIELTYSELESSTLSNQTWEPLKAESTHLTALKKNRDELLGGGRGKKISTKTTEVVWHEAGGRCMYQGCGGDLGVTSLTTKTARTAYLAHIIASNPDGPRGGSSSHELSDSPENIMLMCDEHHRLIDRIDVENHSTERLKVMRNEHATRVNALLEGLKYPRTQAITLLADVAHVSTNIAKSHLNDCILGRQLGPLGDIKDVIRRSQRDDRGRLNFWENLLHEHENDIREFISLTSNRPSQSSTPPPDVLAIFPLHLVPILILAGRVIGEARNVEVFQYARDTRVWHWPLTDNTCTKPNFGLTYKIDDYHNEETILSFELTANLDTKALPIDLALAVKEKRINWIRLTSTLPNHGCINSQERLDAFCKLARKAMAKIQDSWRSKKVHIFGISPASTLFKFGQILQAGHHTAYRIYDRPDGVTLFIPAIEITGNEVSAVQKDSQPPLTINLR